MTVENDLTGTSVRALMGDAAYNKIRGYMARALSGEHVQYEEEIPFSRGGTRHVRAVYMPRRNESGTVEEFVSFISDITTERMALAELNSTLEQLSMIEEAVQAGTWYFDAATGISHWPPGISKLWGLPAKKHEIALDEFSRRIHPEDVERVRAVVMESLEKKQSYEIRFRVLWPDSSVHWLSARGAVLLDSRGAVSGILGIALEATENVRTEEALRQSEKLAATGRLAATIAHEINNPLEAVTNLLYLSRQDATLPPQVDEYLKQADQELKRVSHVTRQTLGFYRESVNAEEVDLSDAVQQVIELYGYRISSKALHVNTQVQENVVIYARPGELRQVISHLILNAVEATSERGSITVRLHQRSGKRIRLMVADNGPGISAHNRAKLFQPFFTTKKDIGTGLGLWVSKGIVEKLNGTIQVRSIEAPSHSGTCFVVDLPTSAG